MWSSDPRAVLHHQQSGEMLGWNLCILSVVLYHLEYILNPFSSVETFKDPLCIWVKIRSHSSCERSVASSPFPILAGRVVFGIVICKQYGVHV